MLKVGAIFPYLNCFTINLGINCLSDLQGYYKHFLQNQHFYNCFDQTILAFS